MRAAGSGTCTLLYHTPSFWRPCSIPCSLPHRLCATLRPPSLRSYIAPAPLPPPSLLPACQVLSGDIAPDVVVVLAPEELASDVKRNENARIREKKLFDSAPAAMKQVGRTEGCWHEARGLVALPSGPELLRSTAAGAADCSSVRAGCQLPFVSLPSCPSSLSSLPPQT